MEIARNGWLAEICGPAHGRRLGVRSGTKVARNGGGYYPLLYYKKLGWAAWRFKKFCTDKKRHVVLKCMTYKVNIEGGAGETREGEVREQSLKGTRKGQAAVANATIMAASRDDQKQGKLADAAQKRESTAAALKAKKESKDAAVVAKTFWPDSRKGRRSRLNVSLWQRLCMLHWRRRSKTAETTPDRTWLASAPPRPL